MTPLKRLRYSTTTPYHLHQQQNHTLNASGDLSGSGIQIHTNQGSGNGFDLSTSTGIVWQGTFSTPALTELYQQLCQHVHSDDEISEVKEMTQHSLLFFTRK